MMDDEDSYEKSKRELEESNALLEPQVRLPKAPMNGFMRYHLQRTCQERSKNPTINFRQLSEKIGEEWKNLDAKKREVFTGQYELKLKARKRLVQEFNRISKSGRILSPYSRYFTKMFPIYQKECPDKKTSEISKLIGEEWKKLDPSKRQTYVEEAQREKLVAARTEVLPEHIESYKDSVQTYEEELKQETEKILKMYNIKKVSRREEWQKRREEAKTKKREQRMEEKRKRAEEKSQRKRQQSEARIKRQQQRRLARIEEKQRRKEQKKVLREEEKRRKKEQIEKRRQQSKRMRSLSKAKAKSAEKVEKKAEKKVEKTQKVEKKDAEKVSTPKSKGKQRSIVEPKTQPKSKSQSKPKKVLATAAASKVEVHVPAPESKTRAASKGKPIEVSSDGSKPEKKAVKPKATQNSVGRPSKPVPAVPKASKQQAPVVKQVTRFIARKSAPGKDSGSSSDSSESVSELNSSEKKAIKRTKQIKKSVPRAQKRVPSPRDPKIQTRKRVAPTTEDPGAEKKPSPSKTGAKIAPKKVGRAKKRLA